MKTFYLWIFIMIVAAFLMAVFLFQCCRVNWWEALYCALQAFVLAEFTTSLSWQIYCFYFYSSVSVVKGFPLFLLFCAIIYPVYWWMMHRRNKTETGMDIYTRDVISVLFITVLTFFVSNLSYILSYFSFVTPFTTGSGETIATLRTMMDGILESQYQQYQQSKESIELVNYKYHDLKHQIEILRMESDPQKREKYLNEMEEDIHQFEIQNKTGNKVLDTLLTGKSITCQKYQIAINCVADGKLLDFFDYAV